MSRWPRVFVLLLTIVPLSSQAADQSGKTVSEARMARDVALDERGFLKGKTSPNMAISFRRDGNEKQLRSGPDGSFSAQILPGVYLVHVGDSTLICRVWGNKVSPPCATDELVLQTTVVRGQNGNGHLWRLDQWTRPALLGLGVAGAIWAAVDGNSAS